MVLFGPAANLQVVMLLNGGVSTPNPHLTALNPHLDVTAYPVMFTNVPWKLGFFPVEMRGKVWVVIVFASKLWSFTWEYSD